MCGIAGIINTNSEARIGAMLKTIEHRGRDDEGVWASDVADDAGRRVCFGHRRLSIIDTGAAGHQPMHDKEKNIAIIFNGEIYNFHEIRKTLISLGHQIYYPDRYRSDYLRLFTMGYSFF